MHGVGEGREGGRGGSRRERVGGRGRRRWERGGGGRRNGWAHRETEDDPGPVREHEAQALLCGYAAIHLHTRVAAYTGVRGCTTFTGCIDSHRAYPADSGV